MTISKTGTREQWLAARLELLEAEKALTRRGDEVARQRRELPWVRLDKDYRFETDDGVAALTDLFRGRSQLLVYHFMFGPDYQAGCPSCSAIADGFNGSVVHLAHHDVTLHAVSQAPLSKLQAYKQRMGWSFPWASSADSDFNYDFRVTHTPEEWESGSVDYNFRSMEVRPSPSGEEIPFLTQIAASVGTDWPTYRQQGPGLSAFVLEDGVVYHTYSSYERGLDSVWGMYQWLDRAPLGRNENGFWASMPDGSQQALTAGLSATDLKTLLLGVAGARAAAVSPAEIMRRWQQDPLVRPAASDPRAVAAMESRLWQLLPAAVDGVELSPLVPLGTCSALGPVSQNKIVTTMRSAEVVSDSTNALAVEAATRRHGGAAQVHLAASHRQLRAQPHGEGQAGHFRLFALVSSAPDTGSGTTEARLLGLHLGYWTTVLQTLLPAHLAPRVAYTVWGNPVVRERIADTVLPALSGSTPPVEEPERVRAQSYYTSAALRLTVLDGDDQVELGDGGFTTWTAQLLGNAKERCLISCLATERLARLVAAAFGEL